MTTTKMGKNLKTLIEGGLSRTTGFTPTPENNSVKDHTEWLEHKLAVAKIPLLNMRYVMGFTPYTFIIEAGCAIDQFRERCHNSGLSFARVKPLNGDSNSCWLEVDADQQNDDYILCGKPALSGLSIFFVRMNGKFFETTHESKRAKIFGFYEDARDTLKKAALAQGVNEKDLDDCWIKHWDIIPVRR